jgi:transcriptional regulator with XRE-family HTH domain
MSSHNEGGTSELGDLLRHYRKRAKLTQVELAGLSTVSLRTIRNLEVGRGVNPRLDTMRLLASGLGLTEDSLAALTRKMGPRMTGDVLTAALGRMPDPRSRSGREPLGRGAEIRSVAEIVRSGDARVVEISGFAGAGKTRLALAAAQAVHEVSGTPWLWLPVADTAPEEPSSAEELPGWSADSLYTQWGRAFAAGEESAIDELASLAGDRPFLLVADGADAAGAEFGAALAELRFRCRAVVVLETSRIPSRRPGRQLVPLKPLALPDRARAASLDDASHAALKLLALHIRAVQPEFEVTDGNVEDLLTVCRRLDGLPRALESAALWFALCAAPGVAEIAVGSPFDLTASPGRSPQEGWASTAIADAIRVLAVPEAELLGALARMELPWNLEQATRAADRSAARVAETLHTLLAFGLIRPVGAAAGAGHAFTVLNLVRAFLA